MGSLFIPYITKPKGPLITKKLMNAHHSDALHSRDLQTFVEATTSPCARNTKFLGAQGTS